MSAWRSPLLYFGIALILAAGAALSAPLFIDWNSYRTSIEDYGRQLTGREVTVRGDITARLFPWPVLRLSDIRIANPPGASVPEFLRTGKIKIKLALAPLLSGRVEVEGVIVDKPVFAFERLATGDGTWALAPQFDLSRIAGSGSVAVSGIEFRNGAVILGDSRRGGQARISNLNATLSAPNLVGPWRFRGVASYGDSPVNVGISTGKYRSNQPLRIGIRLSPAEDAGLIYNFDGTYDRRAVSDSVKGQLKITPVAASDGKSDAQNGLRPIVFNSQVTADFDSVEFGKIEIAPDRETEGGNLLSGTASIKLGTTLTLDTRLSAARFDLDKAVGSRGRELLASGEFLHMLSDFLEGLPDATEAGIDLSVTSLVVGGETLEKIRFKGNLTPETLTVSELSGSMPGQTRGEFAGTFFADSQTPQLSGNLSASALSLRDFMLWALAGKKAEINKVWSGARGRVALIAHLDATPKYLRLRDSKVTLDGASGTGSLTLSGGKKPSLTTELVINSLDLDRYAPRGLTVTAMDAGAPAGARDLISRSMAAVDFHLSLKADVVQLHGVTANKVAIDVSANSDYLDLRTVEIGNVGGAKLDVVGLLQFPGDNIFGSLSADVQASQPLGLMRLFGVLPPESDDVPLPPWAKSLGAVNVKLVGELKPKDGQTDAHIQLNGTAGQSDLNLAVRFVGNPADWQAGEVHLSGDVANKNSAALAAIAGVDISGNTAPGRLAVTGTGRPDKGLAATADLEILDSISQFAGTVTSRKDARLSLKGKAELFSENAAGIFQALGLDHRNVPVNARKLLISSDVALANGTFGFRNLRGDTGGAAFNGDLALKHADGNYALSGNLAVNRLSLPWLLGTQILTRDGRPFGLNSRFDLRFDRNVSAEVTLKAEHLHVAPSIRLEPATVKIAGTPRQFSVAVDGKSKTGKPANGEFSVSRKLTEVQVKGNLNGELRLADVLQAEAGARILDGEVKLTLQFAGAGRSPLGMFSALSGSGNYSLEKAVLRGVNPDAFATGLSVLRNTLDVDQLVDTRLTNGNMEFKGGKGNLKLDAGIVRFSDLDIKAMGASGPLKAIYDIPTSRVDISTRLRLEALAGLPEFELVYSGHPHALQRTTDVAALRSFVGVNILKDGIDKLEKLQREQKRIFDEDIAFQRKQEMKRRAEEAARRKEEANAQALIDEEARKKSEAASREKADKEAREQAAALAKAKTEAEALEKAEALARQEAARKAREEADRKAEEVARAKAAAEVRRQAEARQRSLAKAAAQRIERNKPENSAAQPLPEDAQNKPPAQPEKPEKTETRLPEPSNSLPPTEPGTTATPEPEQQQARPVSRIKRLRKKVEEGGR